jgi:hypothetical protein
MMFGRFGISAEFPGDANARRARANTSRLMVPTLVARYRIAKETSYHAKTARQFPRPPDESIRIVLRLERSQLAKSPPHNSCMCVRRSQH